MTPRSPQALSTASRPVAVGREQFWQMKTMPRVLGYLTEPLRRRFWRPILLSHPRRSIERPHAEWTLA